MQPAFHYGLLRSPSPARATLFGVGMWSRRGGSTLHGRAARRVDLLTRAFLALPGSDLRDSLRERHFESALRARGVVEVRDRDARQPSADARARCPAASFFVRRHERERLAGRLRSAGATDAVNVVIRRLGHVEVDDVAERVDVDAARRDVGGHEHGEPAGS